MSQPAQSNVDVTIGITGFNPYRVSQFKNLSQQCKAGMSRCAAKNYLGAISASLTSPNMVLDLRIPQNQRYQQIVLDTAIAKLLAKETNIGQAMKEIADGWEAITNELGRDAQLRAYRESLGILTKRPEKAAHRASLNRSIALGRRLCPLPRGQAASGPRHLWERRASARPPPGRCARRPRPLCCRPSYCCFSSPSSRCWCRRICPSPAFYLSPVGSRCGGWAWPTIASCWSALNSLISSGCRSLRRSWAGCCSAWRRPSCWLSWCEGSRRRRAAAEWSGGPSLPWWRES